MKAALFGLCLLVAGAGVLVSGARNAEKGRRARLWPTTTGAVLTSRCVDYSDWENGARFIAEVTYEYTVGDQKYRGDRLAFGYDGGWWRAPNARIAEGLAAAQPVTVRYDPRTPSMAVLVTGVRIANIRTMVAGLWLLLLAAMLFRYAAHPDPPPGALSVSWRNRRLVVTSQGLGDVALAAIIGWGVLTVLSAALDWGMLSATTLR
jgi:hypothetical protein